MVFRFSTGKTPCVVFAPFCRLGRACLLYTSQLTAQVADALMAELDCKGAIVYMEAEHMCMTMRGVQKPGTKTATLARRGAFVENPELEARFFRMLGR